MSLQNIITAFKAGKFKPVYWLEGEEPFFIDEVSNFAERHLLSEAEAGFNLSVFYGRDANWADVVNACKRYPMFSDRQVVILKEAQQMRDIEMLENYFQKPNPSTVFIVCYRDKKLDDRKKFSKTVKSKCEVHTTAKIPESKLPEWTLAMAKEMGYTLEPKALALVIDHIGNDIARIKNEIEKLVVNIGDRKKINEDDIEQFVGISKEFNVFEFQNALARKDFPKAIRIVEYFGSNPKAAPLQLILPSLYGYFSKVYSTFGLGTVNDREIAQMAGIPPFFVKDYLQAARNYGQSKVESILLLLHGYNLRSIGIGNSVVDDNGLLKELVSKIILC